LDCARGVALRSATESKDVAPRKRLNHTLYGADETIVVRWPCNWLRKCAARACCVALVGALFSASGGQGGAATRALQAQVPNLDQVLAQAKAGQPKAQAKLGDVYFASGAFTNAALWYRKAAEQGEVEGQLSLASCYLTGRGVAKDPAEAAKWLRLASIQLGETKTSVVASLPPAVAPPQTNARPRSIPMPAFATAGGPPVTNRPRLQRIGRLPSLRPEIEGVALSFRPAGKTP
jgi:hypothetical protein